MIDLRTELLIAAPPRYCFAQLVDFRRYGSWSPVHRRVHRRGDTLRLWLKDAGVLGLWPLPAKIRTEVPPYRFAWGGGLRGAPWILDIHHYFELHALDDHTRMVHGERFSGVVGHVLAKLQARSLRSRYEAFNRAFARRCERGFAA